MKFTRCTIDDALYYGEEKKIPPSVRVAPVTSRQRESYPTRVHFSIGDVSGWIVLDQLRAIDRKRLRRKIGCLDGETALLVKNVIREMLVD